MYHWILDDGFQRESGGGGEMKRLIVVASLVLLAFTVFRGLAEAGSKPPIPVPQVSIAEAVDLATKHLRSGKAPVIDAELAKPEEYIVTSAEYTCRFKDTKETGYAWKIHFVHPVHNDHSIIYRVTSDKKVLVIGGSE